MTDTGWKTSSYSNKHDWMCVEVALGTVVGVRDTKDRERGQLTIGATAWAAFLEGATA